MMENQVHRFSRTCRSGLSLLLCLACVAAFAPSQSEAQTLPVSPGPTYLEAQEEASATRLQRLAEYENTTDVVGYRNNDGTNTVYIYGEDIRYRDQNGQMVEKNIHLAEIPAQERSATGYRYRTAANELTAYYPNSLSQNAIAMEYGEYSITLQPDWDSSAQPVLEDGTKAVYQSSDGEFTAESVLSGTLLRQTVEENAEEVEYVYDFDGLIPTIVEGRVVSLADASGKEQLRIGGLMLTDSDNRFSDDLTLSLAQQSDGTYALQIGLDEEFVETATSAVALNSSVTIPSSSGVQAASVYSGKPTTTHGYSVEHNIGYTSTNSMGTARTYVKFDLSSLNNVRYDNITSACYRFTEGERNGSTAVMEAYFVKSSWSESSITWNNKPDYYGDEVIGRTNINYQSNGITYDLYITSAVQGWLQGLTNYGIVLKEKDDSVWSSMYSDDHSMITPSLVVTYVDEDAPTKAPGIFSGATYYLINKDSEKYLMAAGTTVGSNVTISTTSVTARKVWKITSFGNGYYAITCGNYYLTASGNGPNAGLTLQSYSSSNNRQKWKVVRNWDGSYHLMTKAAEAGDLCLSNGASDGVSARMAVHSVNFSKGDDWTLIPTVKGNASFLYDSQMYKDNPSAMTLLQNNIANMMTSTNNMGYDSAMHTDEYAIFAINKLKNDSLWVATSHGAYSTQIISDGEILSPSNSLFSPAENDFRKLQLAILMGCHAGANTKDDSANLAGLIYKYGAHNVISGPLGLGFPATDYWCLNLFLNLSVAYTLGEAKENADNYLYENYGGDYGNFNARHDLGDNSFRYDLANYPSASSTAVTDATDAPVTMENVQLGRFSEQENQWLTQSGPLYEAVEADTNTQGTAYDVYRNASNDLFFLNADSGALELYLPENEGLQLGDTVVNSAVALQQADAFLTSLGYDLTGYTKTYSNEYSKTFQIAYRYRIGETDTTERIYLYYEAEEDGTVHLVRLAVYDYGAFSSNDSEEVAQTDYDALLPSLEQAAAVKAAGSVFSLSDPVWCRHESGSIQLRADMQYEDEIGNRMVESVYSIIL